MYVSELGADDAYRGIRLSRYKGNAAYLIGFEVTYRESFDETTQYLEEITSCIGRRPVAVAVGNRIDLVNERKVSTEEARSHFENMNPPIPYIETSAKTGENVNKVFDVLVRLWLQNQESEEKDPKKCVIS